MALNLDLHFNTANLTNDLIVDAVGTCQQNLETLPKLIFIEFESFTTTLIINTWKFCRNVAKLRWKEYPIYKSQCLSPPRSGEIVKAISQQLGDEQWSGILSWDGWGNSNNVSYTLQRKLWDGGMAR